MCVIQSRAHEKEVLDLGKIEKSKHLEGKRKKRRKTKEGRRGNDKHCNKAMQMKGGDSKAP